MSCSSWVPSSTLLSSGSIFFEIFSFSPQSTTKREAVPDVSVALKKIGLHAPRPVLVVIGGTSKLSDADLARVRSLFVEALAPLAKRAICFQLFVVEENLFRKKQQHFS